MSKKETWIHYPDGQALQIPAGIGQHLRALGWRPLGEQQPERVAESETPEKSVAKTSKTATNSRKNTLK